MMATMPLMAAAVAAAGGCRRLIHLWATAPSAVNWQEPLGQDGIPPWSSWSRDTKIKVLFGASLVFLIVCFCVLRLFCRHKEDNQQDTSRFVLGPWSNDDDGKAVSAPPPPLEEQEPLPASGMALHRRATTAKMTDLHSDGSGGGGSSCPLWRRCPRPTWS